MRARSSLTPLQHQQLVDLLDDNLRHGAGSNRLGVSRDATDMWLVPGVITIYQNHGRARSRNNGQ